jgi:hypothetical protein
LPQLVQAPDHGCLVGRGRCRYARGRPIAKEVYWPRRARAATEGGVMGLTELDDDPAGPFRPVDWQWRRVVYLVENGRPASPRRDDGWTRAAARFYRALRQCRDEAARQGLARRLPGFFQAHALYAGPPSLVKWELEARLLTPESFGQVAEKCAIKLEAVEAYESLYFCVRDRLHIEGYILHEAIGPRQYAGLTEADVDVILKMYAYASGPIVLDRLVDYFKNPPPEVPVQPEQLSPAELRSLRDRLLIRASIVLDALPINGKTLHRLDVLRDAADVFRRGRGLGDDPDNQWFL